MALKAEISSRVGEILEDPRNAPAMASVLHKMGKLLAKKRSLQSDVPVRVLDNLWIGNYHFANCRSFLQQNSIQHVVSCLEFDLSLHLPHINYLKMPLKDGHDERFEQTVLNFCSFMRNTPGNVYLHCFSGVSRSPALLLSFLISSQQQNYPEALQSLRSIYPKAEPNSYFLTVLSGISPKLLAVSLHQASESKEESMNLLDHVQQVVSSPRKSEGKSLLLQRQNEANLLGFEAVPQSTGNQDLLTIEGAVSEAKPLPILDENYLSYSKQQTAEVTQITQLMDIDLSPKKEIAESINLLAQHFIEEKQSFSKQVNDFSNDLLDLGESIPQKETVQQLVQNKEVGMAELLGHGSASKVELRQNDQKLIGGQGQLIFLPLAVEKTEVQDFAYMEVQIIQQPSSEPAFIDSKAQTTPKQQEGTATGQKEEQFAESNNFTQKKVKNKKKKR